MMFYVPSFPRQSLGLGFLAIKESNQWGIIIDYKFKPRGIDSDYIYNSISINQAENIFNDQYLGSRDIWETFDFGIVRRLISNELLVYGSVGYSSLSRYREYYDRFEILGNHGKYWVEDTAGENKNANFGMGIIYVGENNFSGIFGVNTMPQGVSVGVGYRFL